MTLSESPLGAILRVTSVRLPAVDAFRLNEMGIRLGTLAHVTHHAAFGGGSSPWPVPDMRSMHRLLPSIWSR
jgi:Fe2+ transport system protein FeoA